MVNADPERKAKYGEVLPSLQKAYDELNKTQPRDTLLGQLLSASDLFQLGAVIAANAAEKDKPAAERNPGITALAQRARAAIPEVLGDRLPSYERSMLAFLLRKAAELPPGQKIEAIEKRFGNLKGDDRIRAEEEFAEIGRASCRER